MAENFDADFCEEPEVTRQEVDEQPTFIPVMVETDFFEAETIGMYQMPGLQVLDVITTPGLEQLPKMVALFKLSINDPKKAEDLGILSFEQLTEAVGQWVSKSRLPLPSIDFGDM